MNDNNPKTAFAGKFLAIDGPDGCGKSTQAKLLAEYLAKQHLTVELLRDPGSTVIGEKIRHVLLSPEHDKMATETEVLLYMAVRVQLWHEKIAPALQQNKCVLLDRWLSSTCAYQGHAGDFGIDRIIQIAKDTLPKPWPDLTIVLDVDLQTAANRLSRSLDRMEQKGDSYHKKVCEGFLKLAENRDNFIVIDASESVEQVHRNIIEKLVSWSAD
ncbi:MAG: dTMP kinase [Phycisphaerales bacterium]